MKKTPSIPDLKHWQQAMAKDRGDVAASALAERIRLYYGDLYAQRRHYAHHALRAHLEKSILPGLAAYQVLREDGLDEQEAIATVERFFEAAYATYRWQMVWMARLPFLFPLFRFIIRRILKSNFPQEGWQFEWVEDSPTRLAFNDYCCFYLDVLTEYGVPELTPAFCATDDMMIDNFASRIRWERTTTLGHGGDRCDFRYCSIERASPDA
ncbi:MAG: L-2-amino-thiazoline-4-carboxylic acid hydrolase [Anaerolineae bacterium]|nr:L-2-amino-thiazoline-4-carboxylic acid hydrolase [Anaerolineae bacterium]